MNPNADRQKQNLQRLPRLFCESTMLASNPEQFLMLFSSGQHDVVYTFTPEHAKQFLQSLTHQIDDFEKNVRPINAEWNPNTPSPIQPEHKK